MDHADWNYQPVVGWIERRRFELAVRLIEANRYSRLLEIGYGSGVFMPELANYCGELHGVDAHDLASGVEAKLADAGVNARLHSTGAESLPFYHEYFDCVVAVNSLEFVTDINRVCEEIDRVLTPGGRLIVIMPGSSPVLEAGFKVLTGKSPRALADDGRALVVPELQRWFSVDSVRTTGGGLYQALDCRRRQRVSHAEAPIAELSNARLKLAEHPAQESVAPTGDNPESMMATQSIQAMSQGPTRRRYRIPSEAPGAGELGRIPQEEVERTILAVRRRRHTTTVLEAEREHVAV